MNISDLPFLTEEATIPELTAVLGGRASGTDSFVNPVPPGIPKGSKLLLDRCYCLNVYPTRCVFSYRTPSGEIVQTSSGIEISSSSGKFL
ncbi:MAG: hypothetical protein H0X31_07880 [Nostocaceae cyanobacterium]|nr:hypothetical protein [Nostocaceae cyanobacterium]